MYYHSNYDNDIDVEEHINESNYHARLDTSLSTDNNHRTGSKKSKYGIKHNNQDRALTKDGVVIAQLANGVLTISPGAVEWVTDWDMIHINAFIRTNGCMRRTKEQIMEMSDTGENLLA